MDRGASSQHACPWDVYTDRAALFAQYRFDYPSELVDRTAKLVGLKPDDAVADIGAGTGKLTQHFLDRVSQVFCVEPNAAMMVEAKARLGGRPAFVAVPGRAEATGLADGSVSLIVSGMALDWFDPSAALTEFRRISRRPGWLAVFRYRIEEALFDRLGRTLGKCSASAKVIKPGTADPSAYLAPGYVTLTRHCSCEESWEQFIGGALSAASAPSVGSPEYEEFCEAHRRAFLELSVSGRVRVDYKCTAAIGQLRQG